MNTVTTRDHVKLYVKDWGSGRPVVLIHGWPLSSDTFDDLGMAIANAGMRAIAYDRRGFGRSDQPWDGYDYDTLADDLAAVLEACEAHGAALVGFSMGGGEVVRYMSRHEGRGIERVILVSSVVPYLLKTSANPHGVEHAVFDDMTEQMMRDRAKFWSSFFPQFYGVGLLSHPVSDEVIQWSRQMAMQASLKATLACANAFATTDFHADLPSLTVPTLVIHGTADKTVPIDCTGRQVAAAVPHSRLLEYDGAPHGLFASHKFELVNDVLRFVATGVVEDQTGVVTNTPIQTPY